MEIKRNGSEGSRKGPADYFTGSVRIDPLFEAHAPARVTPVGATCAPDAHTPAPSPPRAQTLTVRAGAGCVCQAVRAPGSKVTLPAVTRAGACASNNGSMRTDPVK